MSRIEPDDLFMEIAKSMSQRSTCNRGQVGCVIVRDRRIIVTGYNGSPPGQPHCLDEGCTNVDVGAEITKAILKLDKGKRWSYDHAAKVAVKVMEQYGVNELGCRRTIHAEANALAFAARHGVSVENATVYCTHGPCLQCAQLMGSAGIVRLVFGVPYRTQEGRHLLTAMSIPNNPHTPS